MTTSVAARAAVPSTSAKPKVDPAHVRAKDVFGDLGTVDACSMVTTGELPNKYSRNGASSSAPGYLIDECELHIRVAPGHTANLWFGQLRTTTAVRALGTVGPAKSAGGGLSIAGGGSGSNYCFTYLFFADGIAMLVDTEVDTGATVAELCTAGHDVTMAIATHLRTNRGVSHKIVQTSSLRHQDACKFLSEGTARSVPGVSAVRKLDNFPARHTCYYQDDADQAVIVQFVWASADLSTVSDATDTTIAGRAAVRRQVDGPAGTTDCEVVTSVTKGSAARYRNFDMVEGVSVTVRRAGRTSSLCGDAQTLATKVWAKLPKL